MFIENLICDIEIQTVLKPSWEWNDTFAAPRGFHALSFRVNGNAHIYNDSNDLHLKSGDVLYVPEAMGYHITSEHEDLYVIHFKTNSDLGTRFERHNSPDTAQLNKLFALCYETWCKKQPGYYFKTLSVFYNILEAITASSTSSLESREHIKIKPAVDYIKTHFNDPNLSINELCRIAGMSDTYLRRLFFRVYKTTPLKYITDLRISYAKELLDSGYYKIQQISELAGFQDSKYFSTVFKQCTGCSPMSYKKATVKI